MTLDTVCMGNERAWAKLQCTVSGGIRITSALIKTIDPEFGARRPDLPADRATVAHADNEVEPCR